MRLYQTDRIRRMLRRLPRGGPLAWLEIVLIVVLGVQIARLIWAVATPLGPYGDWRPREASVMAPAARAALFAQFDPFFRGAADRNQTQAVTALNLKLYGIRLNEASGLGSAIIATPDGQQASFAVGDKVVEGVTLKAVAADHVVLDKSGAAEALYIDQSGSAPMAQPGGPVPLLGASPDDAATPDAMTQVLRGNGATAPPQFSPQAAQPSPATPRP